MSAIDPTGKRLGTYETGKQQIDYILMSPAVSAVGNIVVKKYGEKTNSMAMNRNGMVLGGAVLGVVALATERLKNKGTIIIEHRLDNAENNGKNSGGGNDVEKPQARFEQRDGPQN